MLLAPSQLTKMKHEVNMRLLAFLLLASCSADPIVEYQCGEDGRLMYRQIIEVTYFHQAKTKLGDAVQCMPWRR
jgi:hypothetical protein